MKVLIIYCHPSEDSYTFQVLKQLVGGLKNEGIACEISDLYKMGFKTDLSLTEFEREGHGNLDLPIPEDVQIEHGKISSADCIIFLYPVWWSDCPAKLKGWFDRVLTVGFAYNHSKIASDQRMQTKKLGLAICTAGHPMHFLEKTEIAQSMKKVMLNDRLGERFEHKEMIVLDGTTHLNLVKSNHQKLIRSALNQIKSIQNS